jgi:periplasmic protein TonB
LRHRPKVSERGSTTVSFAIDGGGALGHVRIDQSSGNKGLDQKAVQMVHDAAPFPPPPKSTSSYSIRIDFQ